MTQAPSRPQAGYLLRRWRRQIGRRHRKACTPSRLAVVGRLIRGPVVDGLIEIEKLILTVVYEEACRGGLRIRFAGFAGRRIPWGVSWGGSAGNRFDKDLGRRPRPGARGRGLALEDEKLLQAGLQLHACLRRGRPARSRIQLPSLWAGFRPDDVDRIQGDGPEFLGACHTAGLAAAELMAEHRRECRGLVLYPLDWVSHEWERATAVFADLNAFPKRQVFALHNPADDLTGFRGACEFDLYHSRFRRSRPPASPGSRPTEAVPQEA